jgi:hypothetical protein
MYRELESNLASPKNSRHPARATANEAALKMRDYRPGKSAAGTVRTNTVRKLLGRPVASTGDQNATQL